MMQSLSRGQIAGIVVILLVTTSFIGAVVYGVMFGDTSAARHYSAVSPSVGGAGALPAAKPGTARPNG